MSLEAPWVSSIFGAMLITGEAMATFAVMIVVAAIPGIGPGRCRRSQRPERLNDLGNLLLAFVMLWAYMSFCQFLIVWSGNLTRGDSLVLEKDARRLGVGGPRLDRLPVLPAVFPALDSRKTSGTPGRFWACRVLILVMHWVDLVWLVIPASSEAVEPADSLDRDSSLRLLALAGVGGIWTAVFVARLKRLPLVPLNDPSLVEALEHAGA